ncbi:MAG TPA: helix-turn-helix transcriptional regulator [Solirubrobacterales bacterium]|nr:helix-turn-helix transcriptional regulator [Solirubrobacterales bacterium]
MRLAEQVGGNIAEARQRAGLTQEQLGKRASIRPNDISRLECGHYSPHLQTLVRLAGALEVSAANLLEGVG